MKGRRLSEKLYRVLTKDGLRFLSEIPEDEIILFADDANTEVTFYDSKGNKRHGYMHTVAFSDMPTNRFLEGKKSTKDKYIVDEETIENNTIAFIPYFIEGPYPFKRHGEVGKYYDIVLSKTLNEYIKVYGDKLSAIVLCNRFFYDNKDIALVKRVIEPDKRHLFDKISVSAQKKTVEYRYKQYTGEIGEKILQAYALYGTDYPVVERIEDRYGIFLYYNPDELKKSEVEKSENDEILYLKEGRDFFMSVRDLNEELNELNKKYSKKKAISIASF